MSGRDVKVVLQANRMSIPTFSVLGLLERLGIKNAIYVHQEDVRQFVERHALRRFERELGPGCFDKDSNDNDAV